LLGDEGSLVQFGISYVKELLDKNLSFNGMPPAELVAWLYEPLSEAPRKLAEIGVYSLQVADDHALARLAGKVFPPLCEKLSDLEEVDSVVLAGGLWRLSPLLVDLFCSSMGMPSARCRLQQEEPAMGAVKLAWLLLNEHGSPKSPLLQS
jgi:N-acetylglucosamine kinase-like BadF-type ATPase